MTSAFRTLAAAGAAGVLTLLCAAPGTAAAPVARAQASALVLGIGPAASGSGAYRVENDGNREEAFGENRPALSVLGGQSFLSVGTLAQDATTSVRDGRGSSRACSGLAGDGASVVSAGSGGMCLRPGDNAELSAGTLQFDDITLLEAEAFMGLDDELQGQLRDALQPLLGPLQQGLDTALEQLGNPALVLDLGTIQSQCFAGPDGVGGDSQLTDAGLVIRFPDPIGEIELVSLPASAPPNTKIVTDLDVVVEQLSEALGEQLDVDLGVLGPLDPILAALDLGREELTAAIVDNVISVAAEQLAPLEDNVLEGTINKQTRGQGSITVTALELKVLPVLEEFDLGLLGTQIGTSSCGPSGRVAAPPTETATPTPEPSPTPTADPTPRPSPDVPTSVPAGLDAAPAAAATDGSVNGAIATGALALLGALGAAAGVATYRRALRR